MNGRWLGEPPTHCELCRNKLDRTFIDGKTRMGPWGIMCPACHGGHGYGLGSGRGQKYKLTDGVYVKVEG